MESDFTAATIGIGEELKCTITLMEAGPGEGKQYGRFIVDDSSTKALDFALNYHVTEFSYLYPEVQVLGAIRLADTTWPQEISFQVMGLSDTVELLEPLTVEGETVFHYEIKDSEFAPGGVIKLEMSRRDESFGTFRDRIAIMAKTTEGLYRYPVSISGSIMGDR